MTILKRNLKLRLRIFRPPIFAFSPLVFFSMYSTHSEISQFQFQHKKMYLFQRHLNHFPLPLPLSQICNYRNINYTLELCDTLNLTLSTANCKRETTVTTLPICGWMRALRRHQATRKINLVFGARFNACSNSPFVSHLFETISFPLPPRYYICNL